MSTNDELWELLAKATPRPWYVAVGKNRLIGPCPGKAVALCNYDNGPTEVANADLIVAAVNALPDLLARLDSLAAENERLRADLATTQELLVAQTSRRHEEIQELRAAEAREGGEAVAVGEVRYDIATVSGKHVVAVECENAIMPGTKLYAAPPAAQPERAELDRAATLDAGERPNREDELQAALDGVRGKLAWLEESVRNAGCEIDYSVTPGEGGDDCVWNRRAEEAETPPAPAGDAVANEWKEAILDELAATCQDAPITESPRDILRRVIEWNVDVALAPAASVSFAPPAPAGDAVAGLVGKWRDEAGTVPATDAGWHTRHVLTLCADELAAALQSSGREGMVLVPKDWLDTVFGMAREGCEAPAAASRWCERIDELFFAPTAALDYAHFARHIPPPLAAAQEKNRD